MPPEDPRLIQRRAEPDGVVGVEIDPKELEPPASAVLTSSCWIVFPTTPRPTRLEVKDYLQMWAGAALTASCHNESFVFLWGAPRDGKVKPLLRLCRLSLW